MGKQENRRREELKYCTKQFLWCEDLDTAIAAW